MSFSSDVKKQLCAIKERKECCRMALLYGMLLTAKHEHDGVKFISSSEEAAALCVSLTEKSPARAATVPYATGFETYISEEIYLVLPLMSEKFSLTPIVCERCRNSFFRGLFITCGSVTAPEKGYHLELAATGARTEGIASFAAENGFNFREVVRGAERSLYIKDSEEIEDFLAFIGAAKASLDFMNAKISKEVRNDINRITNFETANIDKAATAAAAQLEAIRALVNSGEIDTLPQELRETAKVRVENPEMSLGELRKLFDPPISKSGLHHRLRKLTELAGIV